jgi:2-polyprenyl-3-methyl-5-hydroxy-6-metoxy-1,4-benzoquinol methylase
MVVGINRPGSGLTVSWIDPSKVEIVYGVEPNARFHPALRAAADSAGLGEKYKILGCGAEDLASHGIERETIDTVICCKVLCGVPVPERVVRDLYSYVVPGGQFLVHEHVQSRDSWAMTWYQGTFASFSVRRGYDRLM